MASPTKPLVSQEKQHGIHYTPLALAGAVARRLASELTERAANSPMLLADPACGDGELLEALVIACRDQSRKTPISVLAYDRDPDAVTATSERLEALGVSCTVECADFLSSRYGGATLFDQVPIDVRTVDAVIANPPYVRTQVLGAAAAQTLGARYGLTGRVDLAYAFVIAMIEALNPGGHFAIILSNKFLTIQAGHALRQFLQSETFISEIWDLGDSRLFSAAVLPVVLFGRRERGAFKSGVPFRSLYAEPLAAAPANAHAEDDSALECFASADTEATFSWKNESWRVRVGELIVKKSAGTWMLDDHAARHATRSSTDQRSMHWRDVLRSSVGIKTTADRVFIRTRAEWEALPVDIRPESALRHPVRLTNDADRWALSAPSDLSSEVLYPYRMDLAKRTVVDMREFPRAASYFASYREQLEGRSYVIEGGREWFEPWVAHQPARWAAPRLICRDIAAEATFAIDDTGAIPNGTLYWIVPRDPSATEILWAACAVANSAWNGEYYDLVLGTRLYAGRRRYNSQALNEFLLPKDDQAMITLADFARDATRVAVAGHVDDLVKIEAEIDNYCRVLFGPAT